MPRGRAAAGRGWCAHSVAPRRALAQPRNPRAFFFVFQKWLRAQRVGRVAPLGGGAKRRAAALGAAQRPKAPPQAAERRAAHEAGNRRKIKKGKRVFLLFILRLLSDKEKELTEKGVGNCPILSLRQSLGYKSHGQHLEYLRYLQKSPRKSR